MYVMSAVILLMALLVIFVPEKDTSVYIPVAVLNNDNSDETEEIVDHLCSMNSIFHFYEEYVYALDPHTANAVAVLNSYMCETGDETPCVVVSTASPYKFPTDVYRAITKKEIADAFKAARSLALLTAVDLPESIATLKEKEVRFTEEKDAADLMSAVLEFAKK